MQRIILLLLLLFPIIGFSQILINKTKAEIKKGVTKLKKESSAYSYNISESDSTLTVTKTDKDTNKEETLLTFDETGKCKMEIIVFNCEHCYKQKLDQLLAIEKYQWKKLNQNQYISSFEENLMIELPAENGSNMMINIIRTEWSKVLYDMLKGN